jgi:hypothetical protein
MSNFVQDPVNGPQLAGSWGIREAFVAVMTTNLPMIFPLLRTLLAPIFGKAFASTGKKSSYKSPAAFQTIGGGPGGSSSYGQNYRRHDPHSALNTNFTLNGSEERIVDNNVKMQDMKTLAVESSVSDDNPQDGIIVSNSVEIMREDRGSNHDSEPRVERVREAW